jgi:hypothetical protein
MSEGELRAERACTWGRSQNTNAWNPMPISFSDNAGYIYVVKTATGSVLSGGKKSFSESNIANIATHEKHGSVVGWLQVPGKVSK